MFNVTLPIRHYKYVQLDPPNSCDEMTCTPNFNYMYLYIELIVVRYIFTHVIIVVKYKKCRSLTLYI